MQVQFLNVAQWMAGFAASVITGTGIFMPNFSVQTANEAPKPKKRTVVRHIETDGKINEDIDALLKKYNVELNDSAGVQRFSFSDDSAGTEIIIIDSENSYGNGFQYYMSDSLVKIQTWTADSLVKLYMPRFDSAHRFYFKNFDKEFYRTWKPNMDSLMKNRTFMFKRFNMDSTMRQFKFDFRSADSALQKFEFEFKDLDGEMKNLDKELKNLDGELKNLDGELKNLDRELHISIPEGAERENVVIQTLPHSKRLQIVQGAPLGADARTRLFMLRNGSVGGDSVRCEKRIIIHNDVVTLPAPPALPNGAVAPVPPVVAFAPIPALPHKSKVVIIKKKGKNKGKTEEPAITATEENTPIDRGRYIPGEYTEANPWNFTISPNPSDGIMNINCELPANDVPVSLGVYDLQGNQVFLKEGISPAEFQNMQLNLSANPTGTYLIQIAQGDRTFTTKFEIQK